MKAGPLWVPLTSRITPACIRVPALLKGCCHRGPCALPSAKSPPPNRAQEVAVGIDLGTTNSAIAILEKGKPRCIPNAEGSTVTPSVVAFTKDGGVYVGSQARKLAVQNPTTTYYSVKRLIGRDFSDPVVPEEIPRLAYKVRADVQRQAGR